MDPILEPATPKPAVAAPIHDPALASPSPSPSPGVIASPLPPCPPLPISYDDLERFGALPEARTIRPKVSAPDVDGNILVELDSKQDLFYAAAALELNTALNQIRGYRLQEEKQQPINGALLYPNSPSPNTKSDSLSVTIEEKPPKSVKMDGSFAREKTKADYPIHGEENVSNAFANLLILFMLMREFGILHAQEQAVRSLRNQIRSELNALKNLDDTNPVKNGPSRFDMALAQLSPKMKDYILSDEPKGKLEAARSDYYKGKNLSEKHTISVDPQGLSAGTITSLLTKAGAYETLQAPLIQAAREHQSLVQKAMQKLDSEGVQQSTSMEMTVRKAPKPK